MSPLETFLKETLSARVAVLGVGSELCRDDAAGLYAVERMRREPGLEKLLLLSGESAPENFTGVIKGFSPDALIVVDAAYMDLPAGSFQLLPYEKAAGLSFSTHMLPLPMLMDYIRAECGCRLYVIGIQPENTGQGLGISPRVREGARKLARMFGKAARDD
ncbi:MAG TPA: hydrogenase 3 maturation endopeptidase HyCI [Clostridia bacterium]|nr:hydrogenase 3 maturation endopeptidase HyCI [Clostridia bacterium]